MLQRNILLKLSGVNLQSLAINPGKIGLLQACCTSKILVQCREKKSSLFPKPERNPRDQYDPETEFGGRIRKKVPYSSPPPSGAVPDMPYDQPITIDTVGSFISDYIPVEKKDMILTPKGIKQRWEAFKMFLMSTYSMVFIKKHTKPFKVRNFADDAQKTFIAVNMALQENDKDRLNDLVVRSVYAALKQQFLDSKNRIYWRFIRTINAPRIVNARVAPVQEKTNLFAQVTVKMHTEQILAITDIHGRRLKGDVKKSKEVIDYVVFERHLVNPYGQWKIIGKLMPQKQIPVSKMPRRIQSTQFARP